MTPPQISTTKSSTPTRTSPKTSTPTGTPPKTSTPTRTTTTSTENILQKLRSSIGQQIETIEQHISKQTKEEPLKNFVEQIFEKAIEVASNMLPKDLLDKVRYQGETLQEGDEYSITELKGAFRKKVESLGSLEHILFIF
jgi:hypothetical protein